MFIKLGLAIVFSGLIGLEREIKERPAGLRTHILVCLGATIFTILGYEAFALSDALARMLSGIITGIGFLGAGTIINSDHRVHGLTTAAGIWVVSAVGIALGLGYYFFALVATAAIMIVLKLHTFEYKLHLKR